MRAVLRDMTTWYRTHDLHTLGLSDSQIYRRVRAGKLHRLTTDLYSTERPTPRQALQALQLRYPSLVYTAETALALHGLGEITAPAKGLVAPEAKNVASPALVATRSRRLRHETVDGFRLTNLLRAGTEAEQVPSGYRRRVERHYHGWRGRSRFDVDFAELRSDERTTAESLTEGLVIGASSQWERTIIQMLFDAGLEPIPNFRLGPYHWDVGFPKTKNVVDLDSWKYHVEEVTPQAFIVERWKTNHAVEVGWMPLRFTDLCTNVMHTEVIQRIVRAVNRAAPRNQPVWEFHPNLY